MRQKAIGFDLDGVLANFTKAYQALLARLSGRNLFEPGDEIDPPTWNWDKDRGYTSAERGAAWEAIKADPNFWRNLDPLQPNVSQVFFRSLQHGPSRDVYFITSRPGIASKAQTEAWLREHLGWRNPTVLVVGTRVKGEACAALGLDAYIDDHYPNVADVVLKSPKTRAYLYSVAHNSYEVNKDFVESLNPPMGIDLLVDKIESLRVKSLEEFLVREVN